MTNWEEIDAYINPESSHTYEDEKGEVMFTLDDIGRGAKRPKVVISSHKIRKIKRKSENIRFKEIKQVIRSYKDREKIPVAASGDFTKVVEADDREKVIKFKQCISPPLSVPAQFKFIHYTPPKINMVLDLDLTLVQAFVVVDDRTLYTLKKNKHVSYFSYRDLQMAVVLRPGLTEFLEAVHQFADLFVYTHGERTYAKILLDKFIDPEKKYIRRDIFFATDASNRNKEKQQKGLKNLFSDPEDIKRSIILDDQNLVWEKCDRQSIIQSLQFAPLHTYDRNFKLTNNYDCFLTCIKNEDIENSDSPFLEKFTSEFSQLRYLSNFLRGSYTDYVITQEKYFNAIIQQKRKRIFKGFTISTKYFLKEVYEIPKGDVKRYVGLAKFMGAVIADEGSHYIFANKKQKTAPEIPIGSYAVHAYFLLCSYFNCTKMPETSFLVTSG